MKKRLLTSLTAALVFFVAASASAAVGQGAKALLDNSGKLSLTAKQKTKIQAIVGKASDEFRRIGNAERGNPDRAAKMDVLRLASQTEAVALLKANQLRKWKQLTGELAAPVSKKQSSDDRMAARSLIIPSVSEMRNPPSPNAFGSTTSIAKTKKHPAIGEGYVILSDHRNKLARQAIERLATHRGGEVLEVSSLGELFKDSAEFKRIQKTLRKMKPRFVAVAPRLESYRENMHLSILKLLTGLDSDPQLDAFPGYLVASNATKLAALVERTINYQGLEKDQITPVSIGAIEDDDARRYRSYQKAKVIQKMFAQQDIESPAIIITTRKSHTERDDFPQLNASEGNISMMPDRMKQTFASLSAPATRALNENNVLFMFGHGTPERIVGTQVDAFAGIDFSDELVFCGSCMSASPYSADRLNLDAKKDDKRFAFHAMDNGSVMMLGHMGLCGGFPKVYPMAEHVMDGLSAGEAYQRLMNALIGRNAIPAYYSEPAPAEAVRPDPANGLLYILWGDPALVPIKK
jgi:hypothetical protein